MTEEYIKLAPEDLRQKLEDGLLKEGTKNLDDGCSVEGSGNNRTFVCKNVDLNQQHFELFSEFTAPKTENFYSIIHVTDSNIHTNKEKYSIGIEEENRPKWLFDRCKFTSPTLEKIINVKFSQCTFENLTLVGSIEDSYFDGCKLKSAVFRGVEIFNNVSFNRGTLKFADFSNAKLASAKFDNIDLAKCKFHYADVGDCNFEPAKNLQLVAFCHADITGSSLPEYIDNFNSVLKTYEDAAKNTRNLFVLLIPLCFYLIFNQFSYEPQKGTLFFMKFEGISLLWYNLAGISLVLSLRYYFLQYLDRMLEQANYMPRVFADGTPIYDKIFPWLFSILVIDNINKNSEIIKLSEKYKNLKFLCKATSNYLPKLTIACLVLIPIIKYLIKLYSP